MKWSAPFRHHFFGWHATKRRLDPRSTRRRPPGNPHGRPATVSAMAGATLTIRGSGFQSGTIVTINGKSAAVTFKVPTLFLVVIPSLTPGSQQIVITNPDGESVSLDAAFFAN